MCCLFWIGFWVTVYAIYSTVIWEARLCGTMVRLPKDLRYESDQSLRENCTLGLRNWTDTLAPKSPWWCNSVGGERPKGGESYITFVPLSPISVEKTCNNQESGSSSARARSRGRSGPSERLSVRYLCCVYVSRLCSTKVCSDLI